MIRSLTIKNYALIQSLELTPSQQLNIITGETGAGKSIMLGALGLLMGKRADTKVLWSETEKCLVEGEFNITNYEMQDLFDELDLDYDELTIIRREISPNGKSRAFVNDTPITLDALKRISHQLMDIHSQHESLELGNNQYQLEVVDQFSQNADLMSDYQMSYRAYKSAQKKYDDLLQQSQSAAQEEDYQRFVLKELEEAELDNIEPESLEAELSILENAEEIQQNLVNGEQLIDNDQYSISGQLQELVGLLRNNARLADKYESLANRAESALIELKDIQDELSRESSQLSHDPQRLEEVKTALSRYYTLQRKHGLNSVTELIEYRDQTAERLELVDNMDEALSGAKSEMEKSMNLAIKQGEKLRKSRTKGSKKLQSEIVRVISEIGIENGTVDIRFEEIEPSPSGLDKCHIYFSANKGIAAQPIKEVASGGEFSRLIFAIKYLIADKTALPTIIFDEIDTGVSGEIALKMVQMMRAMSSNHQVISISHLPQFAAGGHKHYFVYKDHSAAKSVTRIKALTDDERVEVLAQMIGGASPTPMAFESARELLAISA